MFLAGNRVGKSEAGANEAAMHLTGIYPKWWKGKRFDSPILAIAASVTSETTRDILQVKYLGSLFPEEFGIGTIPKDCLGDHSRRQGIANAIDTIKVKHISGGWSTLQFKSYDQGRAKFQGVAPDFIHLDEEPDIQIYTECKRGTMTTGGHIILTMTPLSGMTEVCELFLKDATGKLSVTTAGWNDATHLTEEAKDEMRASLPPHEIEAREKGIPTVGVGKIYTFKQEEISCEPFELPSYYRLAYGLDFGWNNTAAVWGAYNPDTDTWYVYTEYKLGQLDPIAHTQNIIRIGGKGVRGVCDPAGGNSSQADGKKILEQFQHEGLFLQPADNSVSAGINEVYARFRTGRLKIFSTCNEIFSELNVYARDKKGKVIKRNDHLLDALRYLIMSGGEVARPKHSKLKRMFGNKRTKTSWKTA